MEDSSDPVVVPGGVGIGQSFNFMYYGANNGNNDTILYTARVDFRDITPGAPLKF